VVRYHGAGGLAPREPRRQDGALAHPGAAGDQDPSGLAGPEQPLVEPRQHVLAPDEPAVPLPLDREVDQSCLHWRWVRGLTASAHRASLSHRVGARRPSAWRSTLSKDSGVGGEPWVTVLLVEAVI
jgi:hypothetical protein